MTARTVRHRRRADILPFPGTGAGDPQEDQRPRPGHRQADYEVGYGKPPKATRFQPGRSGNPKGRPKGAGNLKTLIERELGRKVVIREDGARRAVSKREVVAKQLVKKALEGEDKAILTLLKISDELETVLKTAAEAWAAASREAPDDTDRAILNEFKAHLLDSINQGIGAREGDRAGEAPEPMEAGDET